MHQPHFIFNAHHAIIGLILNGQKDKAVAMLTRSSDLLRLTLDMGEVTIVAECGKGIDVLACLRQQPVDLVSEMEPAGNSEYDVVMQNGKRLRSSSKTIGERGGIAAGRVVSDSHPYLQRTDAGPGAGPGPVGELPPHPANALPTI